MSEKIYGQFDLETIEKLADIVKNKDLGEITIADGDKVITVKGKKCPPPAPMGMPMPMAVGTTLPATQTAPEASATSAPFHTAAASVYPLPNRPMHQTQPWCLSVADGNQISLFLKRP